MILSFKLRQLQKQNMFMWSM